MLKAYNTLEMNTVHVSYEDFSRLMWDERHCEQLIEIDTHHNLLTKFDCEMSDQSTLIVTRPTREFDYTEVEDLTLLCEHCKSTPITIEIAQFNELDHSPAYGEECNLCHSYACYECAKNGPRPWKCGTFDWLNSDNPVTTADVQSLNCVERKDVWFSICADCFERWNRTTVNTHACEWCNSNALLE